MTVVLQDFTAGCSTELSVSTGKNNLPVLPAHPQSVDDSQTDSQTVGNGPLLCEEGTARGPRHKRYFRMWTLLTFSRKRNEQAKHGSVVFIVVVINRWSLQWLMVL